MAVEIKTAGIAIEKELAKKPARPVQRRPTQALNQASYQGCRVSRSGSERISRTDIVEVLQRRKNNDQKREDIDGGKGEQAPVDENSADVETRPSRKDDLVIPHD
jgi:hypothetical protein